MANDGPSSIRRATRPTFALLHLASQMLGKLRVAHAPWANHGWHATLQPGRRGAGDPADRRRRRQHFTLTLDLCRHAIVLRVSDGERDVLPLDARQHRRASSRPDRHARPRTACRRTSTASPMKLPTRCRSPRTSRRATIDRDSADRLHAALARIVPVFERFRAGFLGKASPVHFFWGSFDLAVTRFSGRAAPPHPGGIPGLPDRITREAYSHEVSSAGFWPGGVAPPAEPIFYSYAYPEPAGLPRFGRRSRRARSSTRRSANSSCPMTQVRRSADPSGHADGVPALDLRRAADLAHWDRAGARARAGRALEPATNG